MDGLTVRSTEGEMFWHWEAARTALRQTRLGTLSGQCCVTAGLAGSSTAHLPSGEAAVRISWLLMKVKRSQANSLTAFADKNKLCAQSGEAALKTSVRVLCFLMITLTLKKGQYFKAKSQFSLPVTFLISPRSMVLISPL